MCADIAMFDIRYRIKNAGPSPDDNRRTELYFAGCDKAASGNPCKNCFNPKLWYRCDGMVKTAAEFVNCLERHKIPKFITIVGGEPTDQIEGLIEFGKLAKEKDYHIILISWHDMTWLEEKLGPTKLYFDIIIPGEYKEELRIYNEEKDDGLHNMVGSANQFIWFPRKHIAISAGEISSMTITKTGMTEVKLNDGRSLWIDRM